MMDDVEPEGGDPPCWAHLFDDEICPGESQERDAAGVVTAVGVGITETDVVDLPAVVQEASARGAAWTRQSEDLDVNLLVFAPDEGVAEHVNTEVDVLLVGIAGSGVVTVDGKRQLLHAGQALVIPKGAHRGTKSMSDPFAYLTCHRHRGGLWPTR